MAVYNCIMILKCLHQNCGHGSVIAEVALPYSLMHNVLVKLKCRSWGTMLLLLLEGFKGTLNSMSISLS